MGKRREPRKEIKIPVRIFGTDSSGQIFSEKVFTTNVSRSGAELVGVQAQLAAEEIVGLTYGTTKCHFRIKWVGEPNTAKAGHVGLANLTPEKALWDFPLPGPTDDGGWRDARDRRKYPRLKLTCPVELHAPNQSSPMRTRTTDLSMGGCYVEMNVPLSRGSEVRLALWLKEVKVWVQGKVVTSTPGFGIGVQFTEISHADIPRLQEYLKSMTRLPSF